MRAAPTVFITTATTRTTRPAIESLTARIVAILFCVCACAGCASSSKTPAKERAPVPDLHIGPLTDYAPAAGVRWALVADLAEVRRFGLLEPILGSTPEGHSAVFPPLYGVDWRNARSVVAAVYEVGTLLLVRTAGREHHVEDAFAAVAGSGAGDERPHPKMRIQTGVIDERPARLVSVRGAFIALSLDDPSLARVAALYALGRLEASPTLLAGAAFRDLPAKVRGAPIAFYAARPASPEPLGRTVIGAASALGLTAEPSDAEWTLSLVLLGTWEPGDAVALEKLWKPISRSPLGHLVGLDAPRRQPTVGATPKLLRLSVGLDAERLASGLRALFSAETQRIFEPSPSDGASEPRTPMGG